MSEQKAGSTSQMRRWLSEARAVPRNDDPQATGLPYADEAELQEAIDNFRRYLEILQEWDSRERRR